MSSQYQYSLLQYHNLRRDEKLTLGVLVLFPEQHHIEFLYPQKLKRLKDAFPQAPEKLLNGWLTGFHWTATSLSKKPELFSNYHLEYSAKSLVENYFLSPDSSALQFSPIRTAVFYRGDVYSVCAQLKELFISVYDGDADEYNQKDNSWLAAQYKKYIREKSADFFKTRPIREDFIAEYNNRQYKFDFAWQNHTLNLVTPVSLDLRKKDSIQRKGELYFGKFSLLRDYALNENVRFDLLVAKPSSRHLYGAYDQAIEDILRAGNIEIIEDANIPSYAERTINEIVLI